MSLQDALKIQEKQKSLRETPLQWAAAIIPIAFYAFMVVGSFWSLFRSTPAREVEELKLYLFFVVCAVVSVMVCNRKARKKITAMEIEILKLKRKLEEKQNEN
jgi:hypothetical protein